IGEEGADSPAQKNICQVLTHATGVDFGLYKQSTVRRRILRRMALRQITDIDRYADSLVKDAREVDALYDDMLINVTSFFRDPEVFKALKTKVYPKLMHGRSPREPVRIWVPGCSTGEEAFSQAMNLIEFLGDRA